MWQIAQREIRAATWLVVVERCFVVAVQRVLDERLQLPVRLKAPGRAYIEGAVSAHALGIGGILVSRAALDERRTDAEDADVAIDIQPDRVLRARRQELTIVGASVARIEQSQL